MIEEQRPDDETIVDGDAATHLEALGLVAVPLPLPESRAEGLPLELVGQHLRLSGTVSLGYHNRLSDFVNNHDGLIKLRDVTVLRRNGDPTKVTSPSIWVNPDEVTLIGEMTDVEEHESMAMEYRREAGAPSHRRHARPHADRGRPPQPGGGPVGFIESRDPGVDPDDRRADPLAGRSPGHLPLRLRR